VGFSHFALKPRISDEQPIYLGKFGEEAVALLGDPDALAGAVAVDADSFLEVIPCHKRKAHRRREDARVPASQELPGATVAVPASWLALLQEPDRHVHRDGRGPPRELENLPECLDSLPARAPRRPRCS
jgi:hypothetical protein